MIIIKNITRGHVEFEYEGKTGIIYGEGLLRGHGSPDYVLYQNTLTHRAPPDHTEPIDRDLKRNLLLELLEAFKVNGMTAEIE